MTCFDFLIVTLSPDLMVNETCPSRVRVRPLLRCPQRHFDLGVIMEDDRPVRQGMGTDGVDKDRIELGKNDGTARGQGIGPSNRWASR